MHSAGRGWGHSRASSPPGCPARSPARAHAHCGAGNPLGLQNDDLVFEKATGSRTAGLLANVSGSRLCVVEIAGKLGAGLAEQGEAAMTAFALDWLAGMFGSDVKQAVKRTHATRWTKEPWALGAFSAASPGGQWAPQGFSGVPRRSRARDAVGGIGGRLGGRRPPRPPGRRKGR